MATCPRCGQRATPLHPLPPGVVTKELLNAMGGPETVTRLEACQECVHELMAEG